MKKHIDHQRLLEVLSYDPERGDFVWLVNRGNIRAGSIAGADHGTGYRVIGLDGQLHLAHRLAWFYSTGSWPRYQIDHINGMKDDNRLSNLREASTAENHQNMPVRADNTSGFTGVHWQTEPRKWMAQIAVRGKRRTLGLFDSKEAAAEAYRAAKAQLHEFQPVAMHLREVGVG